VKADGAVWADIPADLLQGEFDGGRIRELPKIDGRSKEARVAKSAD